tara:strand:- start:3372 stop:3704 length:333 start_codon:yes stop_codon:yes gene_type:complete
MSDWRRDNWFYIGEEEPINWDDIPERIRLLSNKMLKRDKSTYSEEDLKDAGYNFVDAPNFENHNEETHEWFWNKTKWENRELTDREKYIIRPDLAPTDDGPIDNIDKVDE